MGGGAPVPKLADVAVLDGIVADPENACRIPASSEGASATWRFMVLVTQETDNPLISPLGAPIWL